MLPRLLLDTHVLVRWLIESKRLSREQDRTIEAAMLRSEPLAISAMTVLELAMLVSEGRINLNRPLDQFLGDLASNAGVRLLPITFEIALEAAALRPLRDPADRAIVGTARVHRLRLVTSDQHIIDSNLVPVIE